MSSPLGSEPNSPRGRAGHTADRAERHSANSKVARSCRTFHFSINRRIQVVAAFEAGVFSFDISDASTLGDLATRLADLGERHGEALTAVQITKTRLPAPVVGRET